MYQIIAPTKIKMILGDDVNCSNRFNGLSLIILTKYAVDVLMHIIHFGRDLPIECQLHRHSQEDCLLLSLLWAYNREWYRLEPVSESLRNFGLWD